MTPLYGFGVAQEDERTEARVLHGARLLCVASGGEVPLGLAARGAVVDAVDVDVAQLHLCALKLAAARALDPADAARFLGYADGAGRGGIYADLRPRLPEDARTFWDAHLDAIAGGVVGAGRFEGFVRKVRWLITILVGRRWLEALCRADDPAEQARIFDAHVGRPWVRAIFRVAFHPRVYARRGLAAEALAQRDDPESLWDQYFRWLRTFCVATPSADNWFLPFLLLGGLIDPARGPDFLRRPVGAVRFLHADLGSQLAEGHVYDGVHLSNLGDWMDAPAFAALLGTLRRACPPGTPFVWRELQAYRAPIDGVVIDRARGEALRATDRFPFYRIVPGRLDG